MRYNLKLDWQVLLKLQGEWNKLSALRGTATSDVTGAKTAASQHANDEWMLDDS